MISAITTILAAVVAGAAFGALHLVLLRVGTRALARPGAARFFVALAGLRAFILVAALAGMAALGADAGEFLGALAGFVAARFAAIRRVQGRAGEARRWR